jgi:hypothetical protein
MKRQAKAVALGITFAFLLGGIAATASAQDMRDEMRDHPRIVRAIHEMEDAVRYLEEAPNDFGGFKGAAIADTRRAIDSLRMALRYREHRDREREREFERREHDRR